MGLVRPIEVGSIMHAGRPDPCDRPLVGRGCCRYASSDGFDALRRLERRGLVERVRRGQWRLRVVDDDWGTT